MSTFAKLVNDQRPAVKYAIQHFTCKMIAIHYKI